ncbi:unnamed protein product [Coregonus sp. 'balchen']|nr:unnamed protein product [Coregonus sp. 'balchen']
MDDILNPYRLYRLEKLYVQISVSLRLSLSLQDYVFHLVSAVSEWIVAFSFIFFFFTYIHDFKKFTLKLRTEFVDYS